MILKAIICRNGAVYYIHFDTDGDEISLFSFRMIEPMKK